MIEDKECFEGQEHDITCDFMNKFRAIINVRNPLFNLPECDVNIGGQDYYIKKGGLTIKFRKFSTKN